jgi:hypothetical protein
MTKKTTTKTKKEYCDVCGKEIDLTRPYVADELYFKKMRGEEIGAKDAKGTHVGHMKCMFPKERRA